MLENLGSLRLVVILLGALVAGCTTIQTRYEAEALLPRTTFDQAFQAATRAALSAGFTIVSTDKDAGLIYGTRGANALLAHHNPAINISVQALSAGGVTILITSTIGGQVLDYGITEETVTDFCQALQKAAEVSSCNIK